MTPYKYHKAARVGKHADQPIKSKQSDNAMLGASSPADWVVDWLASRVADWRASRQGSWKQRTLLQLTFGK